MPNTVVHCKTLNEAKELMDIYKDNEWNFPPVIEDGGAEASFSNYDGTCYEIESGFSYDMFDTYENDKNYKIIPFPEFKDMVEEQDFERKWTNYNLTKKSLTRKTMSLVKRLTQGSDARALEDCDIINECGDLTKYGREQFTDLIWKKGLNPQEAKDKLIKLAKEEVEENKKK